MGLHWNPHEQKWDRVSPAPTVHSLRQPSRYHVVSDAQLKRDLKGRSLKDIYRENKAGRGDLPMKYEPKHMAVAEVYSWDKRKTERKFTVCGGLYASKQFDSIRDEYMAWCKERGHEPHPASIDPDHPRNTHREKAPKMERVK